MYDVFISYRRAENKDQVDMIHRSLMLSFGENAVFKDSHTLPPGSVFPDYMRKAAAGCRVMVVIIGPAWVSEAQQKRLSDPNDWVRNEILTAINGKWKVLIPVLIGGAKMPEREQLPDVLKPLCDRQAKIITDDDFAIDIDPDVEGLIHSIREHRQGQRAAIRKSWIMSGMFVALLAVLIGVAGGALITRLLQPTPIVTRSPLSGGFVASITDEVVEGEGIQTDAESIPAVQEYVAGGDYIDIARKLGEVEKPSDHVRLLEANSYLLGGCYQTAISQYTDLLEAVPGWEWALNNRGVAYMNLQYEFDLLPNTPFSEDERCLSETPVPRQNYLDLAIGDFTQVITSSASPEMRGLAYVNRGTAHYLVQNNYGDGQDDCNEVINASTDDAQSRIVKRAQLCASAAVIDSHYDPDPAPCDLTEQQAMLETLRADLPDSAYWLGRSKTTQAICDNPNNPEAEAAWEASFADYQTFLTEIASAENPLAIRRDQIDETCILLADNDVDTSLYAVCSEVSTAAS